MEDIIQDELNFYSRMSKPLILNLPNWRDRVLASSWVKKMRDEAAGTENLRVVYLKLLLFALQRRRLVGIFSDDPANYEELEAIPEGFDLNDIAKNLLEVEFAERQDRIKQQVRGQGGSFPPLLTDCSSDFREYVAVQNIPGFGVHSYYAISKEPVNRWNRSERGIFPKLARSAIDTSSPVPQMSDSVADNVECLCVENPDDIDPECKCKMIPPEPKKKPSTKRFGKTPPIPPIGIAAPPDDRSPPTWGSSLSQVKDMPKYVESDEDLRQVGAQGFGLTDALGGFEQFIDEFHKGQIDKVSKMKATHVVIPGGVKGKKEESDDDEYANTGEVAGGGEVKEIDLNVSRREEEIYADSHLISYYRGLLSQTAIKRAIAATRENVAISSPARTGIPLSTPWSSPSPKRLAESESLYQEDVPESSQGPVAPEKSIESSGGEETEEDIEEVFPSDDEFTKWTKRLRAVQRTCEINLTQLDASQQVDKTVVVSKKGVPKQDESCGPGVCGYPCE